MQHVKARTDRTYVLPNPGMMMTDSGLPSALDGQAIMAPNLAISQHVLTQSIIESKLQGEEAPTDKMAAELASCSTRTIRRHRANWLRFRSTKAPPNGPGRPKTITPIMLTALCDQLSLTLCMRLEDMAAFLYKEFEVVVTRFSICRALKDIR